ncbi:MAG: NAD(P)-dependent oxidoreductase [Paludibacter sp.]|nr:NAD(P)-dependent oxidoreductase [Paludibacter sp.]
MKKILVTGGNGYIGARLCLHLANEGYAVTPLCYPSKPSDENWLGKMDDVLVGDVRDDHFLTEISDNGYDVIIHLVSLDHNQSNGNPTFVGSVNISPVWSILDIFSKKGLNKFVYFSTMQVYGALTSEIVTEKKETATLNAYALTHNVGEMICNYYNRTTATECRIVRLSNSYGAPIFDENNCWWLVINDLCKNAYMNHEIVLQSDGTPQRDFIHGWDVCCAVQTIIESSSPALTFNISSGKTLTIMDIALKVQEVYKSKYNIELPIKAAPLKSDIKKKKFLIDNSLICSIGFVPKWTLEQGIADLFTYFERNNG